MSMCDIIGTLKTWSDSNGALCAKLQLQCSTVDDLPSIDDVVGGFKVKPGTISQLIQANTFVTLDDNGTWYPEQSSSASTLSAPLSNPLTLGKMVKPTQNEPGYEESIEEPEKDGDDDAELL